MERDPISEQGIGFTAERLASAAAVYEQLRPAIVRLRDVPLSYTEPVIEPATALGWIERGGGPAA